jgi:diguanylate cyclase (GGDEF)-like protein
LPKLGTVSERTRTPAWELAGECVEEALATGVAPSLARLGRLGQLGSLPSLIGALRTGVGTSSVAESHERERESLGFAPEEVAGELLALGRVLAGRRERVARERLDGCIAAYVARITGELSERARRDPLTGLLNHLAFHRRLGSEVSRARRYRGRIALVLFDLDKFKQINDAEGHQEGDRLLRAFSAALASTVRTSDAAGRVGGDEFAALLLDAKRRSVRAFVERLQERTAGRVAFSAGAAYLPEECTSAEDLLALADSRLYAVKAQKRAA